MKAVIRTGGKQYLVEVGDILDIEKISADKDGKVIFDEVLMISEAEEKDVKVGDPVIKGAKVEALVEDQFKDKKVIVFKMKRRKGYRRTQGHRQNLTKIKITKILV